MSIPDEEVIHEYEGFLLGDEVIYTTPRGTYEVVILELDPENYRAYVQHGNGDCEWAKVTQLREPLL